MDLANPLYRTVTELMTKISNYFENNSRFIFIKDLFIKIHLGGLNSDALANFQY